MRELHVRKKFEGKDLGRIVPVKFRDKNDYIGFDGEVKKKLNLLKEESVEFRKLSDQRGEKDGSVMEKFGDIIARMRNIISRESCFYPESIRKEVVDVALRSGGRIFSNMFHSNGVEYNLRKVPMNCKAV